MRFRTIVIFMMLPIVIPSSTMRSEHKSCWILIVRRCCNVHVDYIAEIAENIVQKVKMFTKLIKILLHNLKLLIQCVRYKIQRILLNSTIISLSLLAIV